MEWTPLDGENDSTQPSAGPQAPDCVHSKSGRKEGSPSAHSANSVSILEACFLYQAPSPFEALS